MRRRRHTAIGVAALAGLRIGYQAALPTARRRNFNSEPSSRRNNERFARTQSDKEPTRLRPANFAPQRKSSTILPSALRVASWTDAGASLLWRFSMPTLDEFLLKDLEYRRDKQW